MYSLNKLTKSISQNQTQKDFGEYIKSAQDKREHMNIQEAKETIEKSPARILCKRRSR